MNINGFNKTTLLDYPKHLAATIFIGGCNFRCPFCHNASLVTKTNSQPTISFEEVFSVLEERKDILEGVCITGGEPTLYKELPDFIKDIKKLGLKVKLDSNGTNPLMLEYLTSNKLIDYIAMDIKNSKEKYELSIGVLNFDLKSVLQSVDFLLKNSIEYEFRTTIVKEHHNLEDIISIGQWIKGANAYYLQNFIDSGDLISDGLSPHTKETMIAFVNALKPFINNVSIRG